MILCAILLLFHIVLFRIVLFRTVFITLLPNTNLTLISN